MANLGLGLLHAVADGREALQIVGVFYYYYYYF
jgi:hypothetical protein